MDGYFVEMISGRTDTKSDFYKTSHLARLAQEGMVFSDAYAPAPVCTPSRNAMLHGMTPARMLNTTLNTKRSKENYRGVTTIPRAIKSANNAYITAHFGKWHIPSITPAEAGYDRSDGATGNGEGDYLDDMKTFLPESDPKRMVSLTRKCNDFIKEQVEADRPFFSSSRTMPFIFGMIRLLPLAKIIENGCAKKATEGLSA